MLEQSLTISTRLKKNGNRISQVDIEKKRNIDDSYTIYYLLGTLVTKDGEGMNTVIQNILEMIDVNEGLLNVDESSTRHS